MGMREKTAWIAVVTTLIIWSYYFSTVWADIAARQLDGEALIWRFAWCLGLSVLAMLPGTILAARLGRQPFDAPPDELERQIEARANRIGLVVLELSVAAVLLAAGWISGLARSDFPADPAGATAIMLVNAILFVMMLSALLRELIHIVQFRMMA